ncbi:flavodoxin [Marinobacterium sp. D7]|uniref:flavodoxin n=1 Tax=Marinobacterium ramblicola TaxID=2849041 RepID=UPI001C2DAEDA|nr:flavodoxin [Marinobacterium ramblicola]MBV1789441.1 flavodoxin [Marinobacterium ramblicola]
MSKIGIFFGTETGTTRLIAKKIYKLLGDGIADKPLNVNRIAPAEMLKYDALILGTPSYGEGDIPGSGVSGCFEPNWSEFLALLGKPDMGGKRITFFGLGAQERYSDRFASSLMALYTTFAMLGAELIGEWSTEGYTFDYSASAIGDRFVGLVIDQRTQGMLTDERLNTWIEQIKPQLVDKLSNVA